MLHPCVLVFGLVAFVNKNIEVSKSGLGHESILQALQNLPITMYSL